MPARHSDTVPREGSKRTVPNDEALSGSRKSRNSFGFDHNRCILDMCVLLGSILGCIKPVALTWE